MSDHDFCREMFKRTMEEARQEFLKEELADVSVSGPYGLGTNRQYHVEGLPFADTPEHSGRYVSACCKWSAKGQAIARNLEEKEASDRFFTVKPSAYRPWSVARLRRRKTSLERTFIQASASLTDAVAKEIDVVRRELAKRASWARKHK